MHFFFWLCTEVFRVTLEIWRWLLSDTYWIPLRQFAVFFIYVLLILLNWHFWSFLNGFACKAFKFRLKCTQATPENQLAFMWDTSTNISMWYLLNCNNEELTNAPHFNYCHVDNYWDKSLSCEYSQLLWEWIQFAISFSTFGPM